MPIPTPNQVTYSAAETKQLRCPSFSSNTSRVRASPVDCSPMTTHWGQGSSELGSRVAVMSNPHSALECSQVSPR